MGSADAWSSCCLSLARRCPIRVARARENAESRGFDPFFREADPFGEAGAVWESDAPRAVEALRVWAPRAEPPREEEADRASAPREFEAWDAVPVREPLAAARVFPALVRVFPALVREPVVLALPGRPAEAGESVVLRATVNVPLRIPEPRDDDGAGTLARGAVVAPRKKPDGRP